MTKKIPQKGIQLKIWGPGGSAPVGYRERQVFGGDTICFEFHADGPDSPSLILDLGTGARLLGAKIQEDQKRLDGPGEYDVLFSHLHLDHVIGLPFFPPLFTPGAKVRIHCGVVEDSKGLFNRLRTLASPPYFPIQPLEWGAASFNTFDPKAKFELAGFKITSIPMNHPGGCCGFRLEGENGVIAVVGDHEHGNEEIDEYIAKVIKGADLLLYDGCFDEEQYDKHVGWGHSTWRKGLEFAEAAGIGSVIIYHHLPEHDDKRLAEIETRMQKEAPHALIARQEMMAVIVKNKVEYLYCK